MTSTYSNPLVDESGNVLFFCGYCGIAMSADDLGDLGLRAPDVGESRDDFLQAELLDEVRHLNCVQAARAS